MFVVAVRLVFGDRMRVPDDSCREDGIFCSVLGKDPNRRKSRSGSRVRANRVGSRPKPERSSSSSHFSPHGTAASDRGSFVLYVEGPRDREILECWARRIDPRLERCIERNTVILGGRRPARAITDFQKRGGIDAGYSGLIVLDGDDLPQSDLPDSDRSGIENGAPGVNSASVRTDAGLEIFVWSLRHIESYLLVPAAIRRMLGLRADDRTVERFIEMHSVTATQYVHSDLAQTPLNLEEANVSANHSDSDVTRRSRGSLHAKRVLGAGGSLSKALGSELRAGDIARAMRLEDLHRDVHTLFTKMSVLSGLRVDGPEIVIRPS
jgi:hypothetical protein